jgi:hypothetical protein
VYALLHKQKTKNSTQDTTENRARNILTLTHKKRSVQPRDPTAPCHIKVSFERKKRRFGHAIVAGMLDMNNVDVE